MALHWLFVCFALFHFLLAKWNAKADFQNWQEGSGYPAIAGLSVTGAKGQRNEG